MKKEEMMKLQKELTGVIANFIEKHWDNQEKVDRPKCDLKVINVSQTTIEQDSLKQVSNLWTFEGSVFVKSADKSEITIQSRYFIVGSASVEFYPNSYEKEVMLPEVKTIVITQIKKL